MPERLGFTIKERNIERWKKGIIGNRGKRKVLNTRKHVMEQSSRTIAGRPWLGCCWTLLVSMRTPLRLSPLLFPLISGCEHRTTATTDLAGVGGVDWGAAGAGMLISPSGLGPSGEARDEDPQMGQ